MKALLTATRDSVQHNTNCIYYKAALQSDHCALAIRIKLFEEKHESTADSYRTLGVIQHAMHVYKAAVQSHQRAFSIRIKLFGEEHESTADSFGNSV